jgi:triacylglycerol lipase
MIQGGRVHVVLVPGFSAFDALGQLEYYAGVTRQYRLWRKANPQPPLVLHYFDNLPTANVATRAARLRSYLVKRLARGEIQGDDTIALVGHSTGGLDIRRLLWDLHHEHDIGVSFAVDGDRRDAVSVSPEEILDRVKRVVFLSTPQRGTNIADWVRRVPRRLLLALARLLVGAARNPLVNDFAVEASRYLGRTIRSHFLFAIGDTIGEMDTWRVRANLARLADAHEAAADIQLYLTHIATDFGAIHDLAAEPDPDGESPAHFDEVQRKQELQAWKRRGIETLSFATLGLQPYRFTSGETVPVWDLLRPSTGPWSLLRDGMAAKVDPIYLAAYRACAGGPLANHLPPGPHVGTNLKTITPQKVEPWDNDGIVNTASMLWPNGPNTLIVDGDHGDIIGHYRLLQAVGCSSQRSFHTYNLLRSGSGFRDDTFREVWQRLLSFCARVDFDQPSRESEDRLAG